MTNLFAELKETHPELLERCDHAMFDKSYDSTDRICDLWDLYGIKAIIDIKNMWKDGEKTRLLKNVTSDSKGTVVCHYPKTGEIRLWSLSSLFLLAKQGCWLIGSLQSDRSRSKKNGAFAKGQVERRR